MICTPAGPCGAAGDRLRPASPPPGQRQLERRLGGFDDFVADLVARTERAQLGGDAAGHRWDVEGDPLAMDLVRLWGYVAETVAAYAELTAGEAYLTTARDWVDLARLARQIGYRPTQRVAAEGWVRFQTDRTANPLVPAGSRVQASGTPFRGPQIYEVVADAQLHADWAELTATWVPRPAAPTGRSVRFLGDPGFRAGDIVLFIAEQPPAATPPDPADWFAYWSWIILLWLGTPSPEITPVALAGVTSRESELGTSLVTFDRDLTGLLSDTTVPYAAYRVLDTASTARRLNRVLHFDEGGNLQSTTLSYSQPPNDDSSVVLDRPLEDLSSGRLVAVVDWEPTGNRGDVVPIADHVPIEWEVAPGTPVRVSRLVFDRDLGTLIGSTRPRSVYVIDRRVVATHYEFPVDAPDDPPGAGLQLRVYPAPASPLPAGHLAVETRQGEQKTWELLSVQVAATQEEADEGSVAGLVLDVLDVAPQGDPSFATASGNVVRVRHGKTVTSVLGSGDGATPNQAFAVPEEPVTAEIGDEGTPRSSLRVRVDGRLWEERATLYAAGPVEAFETALGADGEVEVRFGDGEEGAVPGRGVANIAARYRVGGGTAGEVGPGEIDTLLGSLRGVRTVTGAGPTGGGADQSSEDHLRREAPTRSRSLDRVVVLGDLADLALAFPGVSHTAAWLGEGPPGGGCPPGPHVAVLRSGADGVRAALQAELQHLSAYLDARRDVTVPLCVVSAEVVPVDVALTVVVEAELDPVTMTTGVIAALTDPHGPVAPGQRSLGQPLDRSDVVNAVHAVKGVVGVSTLVLSTPSLSSEASAVGRLPAERHQLLVTTGAPLVQVVAS